MSELMKTKETELPQAETGTNPEPVEKKEVPAPGQDMAEKARKKLDAELKSSKDKAFAEPVIEHLLKRCGEDPGFAADVMQEGKAWENCYEYIYKQARKMATANRAVVRNDVVYEWAEDYYRMTPEQEKMANLPKASSGSAKKAANKSGEKFSAKPARAAQKPEKTSQKHEKTVKDAPESVEKTSVKKEKTDRSEKKKPKDNGIEGQLSLFDFM